MKTTFYFVMICLLVSMPVFAQQSMFDAVAKDGQDVQYYRKYKNTAGSSDSDGKLVPGEYVGRYKVTVMRLSDGTPIGFDIDDAETGEGNASATVVQRNMHYNHFPLTSFLYSTPRGDAYTAIGDLILHNYMHYSNDKTWKKHDYLYIREGATAAPQEEGKKKKKGFLARMKDKANSLGVKKDEYQKIFTAYPADYISSYMESMKAKQDAYTMTSLDRMKLENTKKARAAKVKGVQDYNRKIIESPEYQAALAKQNRDLAYSKGQKVTLVNKTDSTIYLMTGTSSAGGYETLSPGASKTLNCQATWHRGTPGGSSSHQLHAVVNSSGSNCGGTVNIN